MKEKRIGIGNTVSKVDIVVNRVEIKGEAETVSIFSGNNAFAFMFIFIFVFDSGWSFESYSISFLLPDFLGRPENRNLQSRIIHEVLFGKIV